jgi:hypothetical protein
VQSKILNGTIRDPKQLLEYSNKLSSGDIRSFSTLIGKPEKVIEAKIDTDDFNGIADSVGLKPFAPTKSEDDRRGLGLLKQRVEQVIDIEQKNRGRQLTRPEKQELMRREINNKVMLDAFGRDPEVPVGMVPADKLDKAYVNVNGEEVRVAGRVGEVVGAVVLVHPRSLEKAALVVARDRPSPNGAWCAVETGDRRGVVRYALNSGSKGSAASTDCAAPESRHAAR